MVDIDRTNVTRRPPPPDSCTADHNPGRGNPIYPLTASKREVLPLGLGLPGLPVSLAYDSQRAASDANSLRSRALAFGPQWSSSLHRRVLVQGNNAGALVSRGDGRVVSFRAVSGSTFTPDAGVLDTLVRVSSGFRFTDAAAQAEELYDNSGNLVSIAWRSGETAAFTYSTASTPAAVAPAPGYLIRVESNRGQSIALTYELPSGGSAATDGLLAGMADSAARTTTFGYVAGNLSTITWSDAKVRRLHYEQASHPWALTGITDELGVRYANFGYDAEGRAISTEYAGGINRFSTSYDQPPAIVVTENYDAATQTLYRYHDWQAPVGTAVVDPMGSSTAMATTTINGRSYLTSQSQPAGSGCSASTSAMAYDANGNLASRDDFNGSRACYASDPARNLQLTRVEGMAGGAACSVTAPGSALPTGSKKTSTEWHPDWHLPTRVAEGGRITTRVYNGQPDPFAGGAVASCAPGSAMLPSGKPIAVLCKQVEQATSDANGSQGFAAAPQAVPARVRSWTYDAFGQILTERDPLNRTTTRTYYADTTADHTLGDLATLTNPAGITTVFTRYDKNGNLLEAVDANGVASTFVYDPRQRLTSASVAGQATTYTYDPVGQLTRITQPDGSWIGHEYDPAHRLVATKDSAGNRIELTLDNAGNVTARNTKDPAGTLARSMSQSIDPLGRVQQITGRN